MALFSGHVGQGMPHALMMAFRVGKVPMTVERLHAAPLGSTNVESTIHTQTNGQYFSGPAPTIGQPWQQMFSPKSTNRGEQFWEFSTPRERSIECLRRIFPQFSQISSDDVSNPGHVIQGSKDQLLATIDPSNGKRCFVKILFSDESVGKHCAVKDVFTNHMLSNIMGRKRTNNQVRTMEIGGREVMASVSYVAHAEDGRNLNLMSKADDIDFRNPYRNDASDSKVFEMDFDSWARTSLLSMVVNDGDAVQENRQRYYSRHGKVKEVTFDARFDVFDEAAEKRYASQLTHLLEGAYREYRQGNESEFLPKLTQAEFHERFIAAAAKLIETYPEFQSRVESYRHAVTYENDCAMWSRWATRDQYSDLNTRIKDPALHPARDPQKTLAIVEQRYARMVQALSGLAPTGSCAPKKEYDGH